jgi:alkanesulfonate monooxygenase SsuD/methylene tetrahydromethanopterin reductase-like flavin-dependent oxidoreductase (luciferase family)
MASAVDDLSAGRLTLGLGAGWQEREHTLFGFDLLEPKARYDRLEEGLEIVTRLLQSDQPVTFEGRYFQVRGATLLPRPQRDGGPRILIGGDGGRRMRSLIARYAVEWNCIMLTPKVFEERNRLLTEALVAAGRNPGSVRRSMMTGCVFGKDHAALQAKLSTRDRTLEQLHGRGIVAGSPAQVREQLGRLEEAGLERIMLQWLDLNELEGLEALAKAVL